MYVLGIKADLPVGLGNDLRPGGISPGESYLSRFRVFGMYQNPAGRFSWGLFRPRGCLGFGVGHPRWVLGIIAGS